MQLNTRSILPLAILVFLGISAIFVINRLTTDQSAPDSGAATDVRTVLTLTSPSSVVGISNGTNITVSLGLQNTTGISVGEIVLTFDPDILEAQSISEETGILALNKSMDNNNGRITVDIANTGTSDFAEDAVLVDFVFEILDSSVSNTTISTDDETTLGTPNQLVSSGLGSINLAFSVTSCGDGTVQTPNADGFTEQCDNGSQNGVACTPSGGVACQYCNNSCELVTVDAPTTPPTTPPVSTTVTCYRCTTSLNDGNSCESFTATGTCPTGSSSSPTACAVVVGGSCPVSATSGGNNPPAAPPVAPPTTPPPTSVGGAGDSNDDDDLLPETGIIDENPGILIGFLFVLLGVAVYKYWKPV